MVWSRKKGESSYFDKIGNLLGFSNLRDVGLITRLNISTMTIQS